MTPCCSSFDEVILKVTIRVIAMMVDSKEADHFPCLFSLTNSPVLPCYIIVLFQLMFAFVKSKCCFVLEDNYFDPQSLPFKFLLGDQVAKEMFMLRESI